MTDRIRVLHVSDTHIGSSLHQRSRLDEEIRVLQEIALIATTRRCDLLLHTGDVFDKSIISHDAMRTAANFFRDVGIESVIVAGNHDPKGMLAALAGLYALANVHIFTEPGFDFYLPGGRLGLAAVPWVSQRELVRLTEDDFQTRFEDYNAGVQAMAAAVVDDVKREDHDVPIILAMHASINGARVGTGERPLHIGETYAVRAEELPAVDYLALGHFHRHQEIGLLGPMGRGFYVGSPMQQDFGEADLTDRYVNIVDFEDGVLAKVEPVKLESPRHLRDVTLDMAETNLPPEEYLPALRQTVIADDQTWLRLTLRIPERKPGLAEEIRAAFPNVVVLKIEAPEAAPRADDRAILDRTPVEAFRLYWQETEGSDLPDTHRRAFEALLEETESAS